MKSKIVKSVVSGIMAAAMLLTAVPVMAAEPVDAPKAELVSLVSEKEQEDVILSVETEKLNAGEGCIYGCTPTEIYTGLDELEWWVLTPGYSIEQHYNTYIYAKCSHGANSVKITDAMCSYYQSDWVNQKLHITVSYKGLTTMLTVVYQFPLHNYGDMNVSDWFYKDAENVYQKLYMLGLTPTSWGPYDSLSRAQFATILYRMMDEPEYTTTKSFPDVAAGIWYEDPVLWAAENGIVTGYQNGMFGPTDLITRDQMAVMMYRFANAYGFDTSNKANLSGFVDGSHVPSYATEAMSWAVANSIITGKDNGKRLAPLENTARAECAAIVSRFEKWAINYG